MNIKKIDKFIRSSKNYDDLISKISELPKEENKFKGDVFERFCEIYLNVSPAHRLKIKDV